MTEDLWGELPGIDGVRLPKTILAEQASLLGSKTKNLLEGIVRTWKDEEGDLNHELQIVVPAMDNYTYTVVRIWHSIELYPIGFSNATEQSAPVNLSSEAEFIAALKSVLTSARVRRVVSSLLAQASESRIPF